MRSSRGLVLALSALALAVTFLAVALLILLSRDEDVPTAAQKGGSDGSEAPTFSDAEWRWAQGWCVEEVGGVDGVELWSDERPPGFEECVQTQLPRAAEGIEAGRANPDDADLVNPMEAYCVYSAPPAIADDYELAWSALEDCLIEEFGIKGGELAEYSPE